MSKQRSNGRMGQVPTGSSGVSDHNDDVSVDELPGTVTLEPQHDGSLKKKPKGPRRRKKFPPDRRREVAMVRQRGACERCREKKTACRHVLEDPVEDLNLIGSQWPPTYDDQPPPESYNPAINLHANGPIPQNRMERLRYIDRWCTIADDSAGTSAAPASLSTSQHTHPYDTNFSSNRYLSPNLFPQNFLSPTNTPSVGTYDREDMSHGFHEEGSGGAPAFPERHELPLTQPLTLGELNQQQHYYESPVDEHHPNHLLSPDPAPMEWQRADVGQDAVPFRAADRTGLDMEMQMGKMAQVKLLIDGAYHPGMEDHWISQPSPSVLGEEVMAQMAYQLGRLRTSSRAAASASGRSQARVQREPRRRSTNPLRQGDHCHGFGHGRQVSQPRRLSIPGPIYGSRMHGMDAMSTAQRPPMAAAEQQFGPGDPSPLTRQGYQQPSSAWLQPSLAAVQQRPREMYVTEHAVPHPMPDWNPQNLFPPSPSGPPLQRGHAGEGYLPMGDHLPFARTPPNMPTALQSLPYAHRSMISDSDFGGDLPPGSHDSTPSHLQPRPYHADGASSASRHHSRQPSIAVNDEFVLVPEQSFHNDGISHPEPSSSNAFSYPLLEFSASYNGSVSSAENDSVLSAINPVQTAQHRHATGAIDIGRASIHAGGSNGAQYVVVADVNEKFVTATATEVKVQDGNVPQNSARDDLSFLAWGQWEME